MENSDSAKKGKTKSGAVKIAGIASTIMWICSFVLLVTFKAGDKNVWISDALLLTGFWPVLFVYKAGWTWFIFGILNMAIGFILEVARQLPEEVFTKAALTSEMMQTKEHVLTMHPCMPWIIIGFFSSLFGAARIIRTIFKWCMKLNKAKKQSETTDKVD